MSDFESKFNGRRIDHRYQMLAWLKMLAREIANGPKGLKFKADPFKSAKRVEWIPESCRTKKQALVFLVDLAVQGFGFVPKDNVKVQYYAALNAKRQAQRKAS